MNKEKEFVFEFYRPTKNLIKKKNTHFFISLTRYI